MEGKKPMLKSIYALPRREKERSRLTPIPLGGWGSAFVVGVLWVLYDPLSVQGLSILRVLERDSVAESLSALHTGWLHWGLLLVLVLLFTGSTGWPLTRPVRLGVLGLVFVLGMVWTASTAFALRGAWLAKQWEGRDIRITGLVVQLPAKRSDGSPARFAMKVLRAESKAGQEIGFSGRVRLSWKRASNMRLGQVWNMTVRLKRPRGLANPYGFDYEAWLFAQRYRATGYVRDRDSEPLELPSVDGAGWRHGVDLWRQSLIQAVPDVPFNGVLRALLVGDRSGLSQTQWRVFRRTGTGHLVAISGLHIGLMAAMAYFLVRWSARWGPLGNLLARRRGTRVQYAALIAFVMAAIYAAMAGFSVPTQRALIMLLIGLAALLLRLPLQSWRVWWLALMGVLLVDPLAPLAAGFWLSFAAVAWILLAYQGRRPVRGSTLMWKWGRIHWVLALGLAPMTLFWFSQASVIAPLANLIAVPWMSLFVVPLTLLGGLLSQVWSPAGALLMNWADSLLEPLWMLLQWMSSLPMASWEVPTLEPLSLGLALLAMLLLILPRGFPGRGLFVPLLLPMVMLNLHGDEARPDADLADGEFRLTLLDVGQGLSAVLRTRNRVLLYDTGPAYPSGFDTGEAVVVPWLRAEGHRHLDTLLISHGDNDHRGGLESVLKAVSAQRLLSGEPSRVPGASPCVSGLEWQWDGVRFSVLAPPQGVAWKGNHASCVLRVENGKASAMLTADLEARGERYLLEQHRDSLDTDVLQVPHHGSRSSSTVAFVAAVDPTLALITSGYRNRFGLPRAEIQDRYRARGARLFNTRETGALELCFRADGRIEGPVAWREHQRRIWR